MPLDGPIIVEPKARDGTIYAQEECCWHRGGSQYVPHLLGQVCAYYGQTNFETLSTEARPDVDAVLVFSWIFGDDFKPFVDALLERGRKVTLVANPASSTDRLQSVFPSASVLPTTCFTRQLRPVRLAMESSRPSFTIQFATGCDWGCPYCVWRPKRVLYSPTLVAAEIAARMATWDNKIPFTLLGNELSGDHEWLKSLCSKMPDDALFRSDLNIRNTTVADVDVANAAGLRFVTLGVEFLTDSKLRELNKGHSVEDSFRVMEWCQDVGVQYRFSLRSGIGETVADLRELAENLQRMHARGLKPQHINCGSPMFGWPGTAWCRRLAKEKQVIITHSTTFPRLVRKNNLQAEWAKLRDQIHNYGWT